MDLTPQLLHDAEFREARRGGYDTRDVDEFLERVAVGVGELHDRLRQALERADAAETRAASAERAAAEAPARTRESDDLDETLKRTLVLAQRTADAAIKEAEEQAASTLAAAQAEAERLSQEARELADNLRETAEAEARRGADEAREAAFAEVNELNGTRDVLQSDVDALAAHLDDQRNRLRQAADSLQRLLDDPAGLRESPAPSLSGIVIEEPPAVAAPETEAFSSYESEVELDEWGEPQERPLRAGGFGEPAEPVRPLRADEPVDPLAERDPGDEEYLAELRKAMTDESPLGPRDEEGDADAEDFFDVGKSRRERSRFGRKG